jgi:hypothetical protein
MFPNIGQPVKRPWLSAVTAYHRTVITKSRVQIIPGRVFTDARLVVVRAFAYILDADSKPFIYTLSVHPDKKVHVLIVE